MTGVSDFDISVIIPTFRGCDELPSCISTLQQQLGAPRFQIIVVDNGADPATKKIISSLPEDVVIIRSERNLGFAGGVNLGIRHALKHPVTYIALLNDDTVVDKGWLQALYDEMSSDPKIGIVTSKITDITGKTLDSTGELYSIWNLPFPRGRGEFDRGQYKIGDFVFGASGGASLYRVEMLREIGLFDEDFFAYYEDDDLSWRAQLAGWKVRFTPTACVAHHIGTTSSKIKGLATYQTFKNLPWLLWKNVPMQLLPTVLPRFALAHGAIFVSSMLQGKGWWVLKGFVVSLILLPKKLWQRLQIQKGRKVTLNYIRSMMTYDLPPNASRLRRLRAVFIRSTS